jgi:hypothetical protein
MKTYKPEDVFSWSNATDAMSYVQNKGYFGDNTRELEENILKNRIETLTYVDVEYGCFRGSAPDEFEYTLFIPIDKVKEVKEKEHILGSEITYRIMLNGEQLCFLK